MESEVTGELETLDPAAGDTHLTQITIFTMETVFLLQKLTWDYEDGEEDRGHAPNADILVNDKLSKTLQKLDSSVIGRSPVTAERQTGNGIRRICRQIWWYTIRQSRPVMFLQPPIGQVIFVNFNCALNAIIYIIAGLIDTRHESNICSTLNSGIVRPKQFWLEKDIQKSSNWKTTTFKHYFVESVLKLSCHFKRLMKNRSSCIGGNREAMKWGPFNVIWYFLKTRCKIT